MRGILHQPVAFMSQHFSYIHQAAATPLALSPVKLLTLQSKGNTLKSFWLAHPYPNFVAASSSASVTAPGDADQLLDKKTKNRKKRIAGVDQDELLDPALLADPDSCFCEFEGVKIHHKLYRSNVESQAHAASKSSQALSLSPKLGFPFILLHGFGASVFSWRRVMKPLAELTSSKVLAFDRPAFGLTSRLDLSALGAEDTVPLNPYSMAFSVLATLYFIDSLEAEKAVLVGHSAGSLVAVNTYFEAPEHIAALILVAPAILAPRAFRKVIEGSNPGINNQSKRETADPNKLGKLLMELLTVVAKSAAYIVQAIVGMVKGMSDAVNSFYKKALSAILRSAFGVMLIRVVIDKFGIAAVRNAWYNTNEVSEDVLAGYTKPLRAKGWDKALAEFTAAMLTSSESEAKPSFSKRLHSISCPVLIITGDNDRLVPSWNAKRLSQAIPGSYLEVIKHCGHLPHEEKVEEFVLAVEKFLQRAFYDSEKLSWQSA